MPASMATCSSPTPVTGSDSAGVGVVIGATGGGVEFGIRAGVGVIKVGVVVGVEGGAGVGVTAGGVTLGVDVGVGGVGVTTAAVQTGLVMVFVSNVTAPLRAKTLPSIVAPVVAVIEVKARTLPEKLEFVPSVADEPTCQ